MVLDNEAAESLTQNWLPDEEDNNPLDATSSNNYIKLLQHNSGLKLLQETKIRKAYDQSGKFGLFKLFITNNWLIQMRKWINQKIVEEGKVAITDKKFRAYMGLEMAMSIIKINDLKHYWRRDMFAGHPDFVSVMSRDDFLSIRANVVLRDSTTYTHEEASTDPLWHSRKFMEHFQKNASKIAVPMGTSALDEASVRTKARTKARSFIANKPDKYAIRFYAVVGTKHCYLHSIIDNRSGNTSTISAPEAFCRLHREMRTPYNNIICTSPDIDKDSATALWILQMGYQTLLAKDTSGKRLFFTDNFYTRHVLAKVLKQITDGEARICGTVKFTNVDATNRTYLLKGIEELKDLPRGSWKLIQAFDKVAGLEKLRRKHAAEQKKLPKDQRVTFEAPKDNVAENAGYVIWKDSKTVIFYCNDLAGTPTTPIQDGEMIEAILLVNGLASLNRWIGGEVMNRTEFHVPSIIVAYNNYMNGVDRMDQMRATNPIKRREKRLYMSVWTYFLDLATHQAFALYKVIREDDDMNLKEFKRAICEDLVTPYKELDSSTRKRHRTKEHYHINMHVEDMLGSNTHDHMLIENKDKNDIHCYFCLMRGIKKKTIYGCVTCAKGFHVNCFTAYHCQGALEGDAKALADMIMNTDPYDLPRGYNKVSKHIGTMKDMKLTR